MGQRRAAEVARNGFDIVAIDTIDTECLARNLESNACEKLLDKICGALEASGIVDDIALFQGEGTGYLKKAALQIVSFGYFREWHSATLANEMTRSGKISEKF
jgi:hypothetical protein